jgi:uncharacterized cupin superfamily protein
MNDIVVRHAPARHELDTLGVFGWPVWSKGVSEFPWTYGEPEICYFLDGEAIVTPAGGEPVVVGKGDLVTFPTGMACTWQVYRPVRKHYRFG